MPKGCHSNHAKGSSHPRWNNGQTVREHGYIKIQVGKEHPAADSNGYAYLHALVWLSAGNPMPAPDFILHHDNEDKRDNRIENLKLLSRVEHGVMHGNGIPDEFVAQIRTLYANGELDMPRLAERYGISIARVSKIIRGETRLSAGGPISKHNRGKAAAGRTLDGREWNEFPEVQHA